MCLPGGYRGFVLQSKDKLSNGKSKGSVISVIHNPWQLEVIPRISFPLEDKNVNTQTSTSTSTCRVLTVPALFLSHKNCNGDDLSPPLVQYLQLSHQLNSGSPNPADNVNGNVNIHSNVNRSNISILLLRSGRFATVIFSQSKCLAHGVCTKYTTQRGQDGLQSTQDSQKKRRALVRSSVGQERWSCDRT